MKERCVFIILTFFLTWNKIIKDTYVIKRRVLLQKQWNSWSFLELLFLFYFILFYALGELRLCQILLLKNVANSWQDSIRRRLTMSASNEDKYHLILNVLGKPRPLRGEDRRSLFIDQTRCQVIWDIGVFGLEQQLDN